MSKNKAAIIKKYRKEKEMTQEELAKKIGVSKQTVQRYESGEITNIPSDKIEIIASCLGVDPWVIMGWEDNLNKPNADLLADVLTDSKMLEYIAKLQKISKDHQQTIYDNIDFWFEKDNRSI